MKAIRHERHFFFRASIILISLSILALSALPGLQLNGQFWPAITAVGFVIFLANFPLSIFLGEVTLISVVTLGGGLIFGLQTTIWIIASGTSLGYCIRRIYQSVPIVSHSKASEWWLNLGFEVGINVVPIALAFTILGNPEMTVYNMAGGKVWGMATLPAIAFVLLHGLLIWLDGITRWGYGVVSNRGDLFSLAIIELLPVPLLLVSVESYAYVGNKYIVALGGILAVIAVLLYGVTAARADLQKRVRELSTLSNVGQALRSSLDLDDLLPIIQEQVMQVLEVDNFYVALVDFHTDELWYPLAVQFGKRTPWPRRPMADRLTDRVIREGEAIILTPQIQSGPDPIGLPPSEATPRSWLGVPLVTPERVIGCLAVFDVLSGVEFSQYDLDLLTTLSAQVSIAIDNALLYDQVQERAAQLETLNQLTGQITASLDLEEVLSQVCQAVAQVGGSQRSAIYLYDPGEDMVHLASHRGLSEEFAQRNKEFSIGSGRRTRCMRTGTVLLTPDMKNTSLPVELALSLQSDGIQAFADFPLVTPDGQIGFLSVFHDVSHDFSREEVELLQTFAAQAALAVANARLHSTTDEKLTRRVHQLAILEAVGRELSAASHSEHLFRLILNYAVDFTQAPIGGIITHDFETGLAHFEAKHGYPVLDTLPMNKGITLRALRTGQVQNVGDVRLDGDFYDVLGGKTRSQLSVPILHEGNALGVITLESFVLDAFSDDEQSLVEQLANQAAVAIQNARLFSETTQRREQLSAVINSVAESIVMINTEGFVTLFNQPALNLTGLSNAQLARTHLRDLSEGVLTRMGYQRQELLVLLDEVADGKIPVTSRSVYQVSGVEPISVLERDTLLVMGPGDQALGWMIVWRDVTEEHKVNQEREAIADALIHDLRSPVSAVLGSIDLLDESIPSEFHDEVIARSLQVARRGAKRVLRLIMSLLDVARMQSGRIELNKEPVELPALVTELLMDIEMVAEEYGISVINEVAEDLPVVFVDKDKISRVITNLLDNAVKFSTENGEVRIAAHAADEEIIIWVSDQGPGISEEYRSIIFERFAQISGQFGRWRGAGLGLAFSRLVIEAHGGKIWVEDPPDGQGSIFMMTLPSRQGSTVQKS